MQINVKEIIYYDVNATDNEKYSSRDINKMLIDVYVAAYKKGYALGRYEEFMDDPVYDDTIEWLNDYED